MAPCRTGTMTGAMQGSTHSLRHFIRTRVARQRRAAAGRVPLRQVSSCGEEIALIHQQFAHRFFLAMQEVCVTTRSAMMQRLTHEKDAELARVRLKSAAMATAVRVERNTAHVLRRGFRAASIGCCAHTETQRARRGQFLPRRPFCARSRAPRRSATMELFAPHSV